MLEITRCPTCGSDKIGKVTRDLHRTVKGEAYTVPAVEFYECPDCAECIFDVDAMRKIESYSPAFAKPRRKKKAA